MRPFKLFIGLVKSALASVRLGRPVRLVPVRVAFRCAHCGLCVTRFRHTIPMPLWSIPTYVDMGFDKVRLGGVERVGIMVDLVVALEEYDALTGEGRLLFEPIRLDPNLTSDGVALAVSEFRKAGWAFDEPYDAAWTPRWDDHRMEPAREIAKMRKGKPYHAPQDAVPEEVPEEEDPDAPAGC